MNNITLHVTIGTRRTTISVHPTLVRLAEIALGSRRELERRLSDDLTRLLGEIRPGRVARPGIGRYAVDIILSVIARPKLWEELERERWEEYEAPAVG